MNESEGECSFRNRIHREIESKAGYKTYGAIESRPEPRASRRSPRIFLVS